MARGFQVCVHAIGDRANTLTLDTFERALAARPAARLLRPRVEHAQILAEADIPRFRALGVLPSMQATHCTSDMAVGARAPRAGAAPGRLRLALAPRHRRDHRGRLRLPGGEPEPVPRPLRCRRAPAADGRGPRVAARAADDARGGRALVHDVERLRLPPGGGARRAHTGPARRPHRLLRRRLHVPRGAHQGHRPARHRCWGASSCTSAQRPRDEAATPPHAGGAGRVVLPS